MSRFARRARVFFVEEPEFGEGEPRMSVRICERSGVRVVTPHLPAHVARPGYDILKALLQEFAVENGIDKPVVWFYTPMALQFFPENIVPAVTVYDCMDELSMFRGAPRELGLLEEDLLRRADLVFTGGVSLFEAKRGRHPQVHAFPSGVDVAHFAQARDQEDGYNEQQNMPRPRLGYAGVIDERLDLDLIAGIAKARPAWQIVMIGPTAKITPESLPRAANIHWLGMKDYQDLPKYFAGWDVGIMPFALNDATRFISPTKTPEYLAAGLPVVSTPIRDVVRPYGDLGLAHIAENVDEFVAAAEHAMRASMGLKWRERADDFLQTMSWDSVWSGMSKLIESARKPEITATATGIGFKTIPQGEIARA